MILIHGYNDDKKEVDIIERTYKGIAYYNKYKLSYYDLENCVSGYIQHFNEKGFFQVFESNCIKMPKLNFA